MDIIGLMDKEMGGSKGGNKHLKKGTSHNGYDMRTATKNTCFHLVEPWREMMKTGSEKMIPSFAIRKWTWKKKHGFPVTPYIINHHYIHPGRLTWNLENRPLEKEKSSCKPSFSASMLILGGCNHINIYIHITKQVFPTNDLGIAHPRIQAKPSPIYVKK